MRYLYTINGQQFDVSIGTSAGSAGASAAPRFSASSLASMPVGGAGEEITAPAQGFMGGVNVSIGQSVSAGEVLALLESGGVQNPVTATRGGLVKQVLVKKGTSVEAGDVIVVLS